MNWQDFERSLFGKASTAEPARTRPEPALPLSPFRRNLNWIKTALGLQAGSPPQTLNTNQIVAAMDALQDGWPFATFRCETTSVTVGGQVICTADPAQLQRIVAIDMAYIDTLALGVPVNVILRIGQFNDATGAGNLVGVSRLTLAPAAEAETVDILQSRMLYVPPGYFLTLNGAIPAGNSVLVHAAIASIPGGFRP